MWGGHSGERDVERRLRGNGCEEGLWGEECGEGTVDVERGLWGKECGEGTVEKGVWRGNSGERDAERGLWGRNMERGL